MQLETNQQSVTNNENTNVFIKRVRWVRMIGLTDVPLWPDIGLLQMYPAATHFFLTLLICTSKEPQKVQKL